MSVLKKFSESEKVLSFEVQECGIKDLHLCYECKIETDTGYYKVDMPQFFHQTELERGDMMLKELEENPIEYIINYIEEEEGREGNISNYEEEEIVLYKKNSINRGIEKSLLDCRYGDQCKRRDCEFNHPTKSLMKQCKYDNNCKRRECKFNHTVGICRFDMKCQRKGCRFRHLRPIGICKYGNSCRRQNCRFRHI